MAEISRFWEGTLVGDAVAQAPYDAPSEFSEAMAGLDGTSGNINNGGVVRGALNGLAASGATSPISIASGIAVVAGGWYKNDAAVSIAVPTPISATRIDRVVLRKGWTSATIRLALDNGVEGSGVPPAMTQIFGTTWEFPLFQVVVTTGGAISFIDERNYVGGLMAGPIGSGYGAAAAITGTSVQHFKGAFNVTLPPGGGRLAILMQQAFDFTNITFHTNTDAFTVECKVDGADTVRVEQQIVQSYSSVRFTMQMATLVESLSAGVHVIDFYGYFANDTGAVATPVNDARWSRYSIQGIG